MTGATPQEKGEQTQPMAVPPWPRVAGGWPSGRGERGPYADADTVDGVPADLPGHGTLDLGTVSEATGAAAAQPESGGYRGTGEDRR